MKVVAAAVLVASLSAVALAAPLATITAPAGWTAETMSDAEMTAIGKNEGVHRAEGWQWVSPDTVTTLTVLELDTSNEQISTSGLLEGIEQGIVEGVGTATKLGKTHKLDGHKVIIDEVIESGGIRSHMRRHYAADAKGVLHMVNASCNTTDGKPNAACDAALDTLALPIAAVALEDGNAGLIRILKIAGLGAVALFGIIFLVSKLRRR